MLQTGEERLNQVWLYTPAIPELGWLRQEDCDFDIFLDCIVRPWLPKKKKKEEREKKELICRLYGQDS